jgi:hypothetical protein
MLESVKVRCHIGLGTGSQQPIRSVGGNRLLLKSLDEENPIRHMVLTAPKALLASGGAAEPWVRDEQMSANQEWLTGPCSHRLPQSRD